MDLSGPRTTLEALVRERAASYDAIVREFDELALTLGLDATLSARHLRRLATGERTRTTTRPATRRILENLFGLTLEELLQPWSPPPTSPSPNSQELLLMSVRRARQFSTAATGSLSTDALDQLNADVSGIADRYPRDALGHVLGDLVETQDTLLDLLDRRHGVDDNRRLAVLAGTVHGILAKAAHDMGDPAGALTHTRTGFLLADMADHDGLRAWVRALQSFVSFWAGRPHDAIRYAEQGQPFAEAAGGTAGVFLAANEARAWATLGNAEQTRAAIDRGQRAAEAAAPDEIDQFGGICTFPRARQLYYAADAFALAGIDAEAERWAAEAIDAYADPSQPDWSFSDLAGSHADLAIARIRSGEIDGAAEAIEPVLELEPARRINGIITSANRVHQALADAGPDSPTALDLQREIEVFTRTPPAALKV